MAYTTIDKPEDYFNTKLYTGTTAAQSLTGVGFQPDLTWIKVRSATAYSVFQDSVRGATGTDSYLITTSAAASDVSDAITSFDSDGFSLGTDSNDRSNYASQTHVAWNWLAGGTASSNTDGSITSSVSANTTAGFSIVSFTATGSAATVGHGLGVAPKVVIVKDRDATGNWYTYHEKIGNTKAIYLDLTNAESSASANFWNNTSPTTSVFSIASAFNSNAQIAYCFAEKKGYSKFGSYTGIASSDSNFVYLGFKPSFLLIKNTSTSGTNWHIYDNKRLGYNVDNNMLRANLNNASQTDDDIDLLSNGFKLRRSTSALNNSGDNFIYLAIAENPFVTSTGIPTTAR